jgi:hypothetical membrane protein
VDSSTPRRWSEAALLGILIYVVLDVALVFLRPHLSVLHSAESDYGSAGAYAWVMDINFVLRCLLSLSALGALVLTAPPGKLGSGPWFLAVWAVCSGLLAFFPDDPVGTHTHGSGSVHLALAGVAFLCVILGTILTTRALRADERFASSRRLLLATSLGALVPIVLLGHSHLRPQSLGGLYEKIFLGLELAWFALLAVRLAGIDAKPATRDA